MPDAYTSLRNANLSAHAFLSFLRVTRCCEYVSVFRICWLVSCCRSSVCRLHVNVLGGWCSKFACRSPTFPLLHVFLHFLFFFCHFSASYSYYLFHFRDDATCGLFTPRGRGTLFDVAKCRFCFDLEETNPKRGRTQPRALAVAVGTCSCCFSWFCWTVQKNCVENRKRVCSACHDEFERLRDARCYEYVTVFQILLACFLLTVISLPIDCKYWSIYANLSTWEHSVFCVVAYRTTKDVKSFS